MSAYLTSNDVLNALSTFFGDCYSKDGYNPRTVFENCVFNSMRAKYPEETDYEYLRNDAQAVVSIEYKANYSEYKNLTWSYLCYVHLLKENEDSLKALYPDHSDMWVNDYQFKVSSTVRAWIRNRDTKGLANLASMLRGYDYQSCEHKDHEKSVGYFLQQSIKEGLLKLLIDYQLEDNKPWASWTDPQLEKHVMCLSDML